MPSGSPIAEWFSWRISVERPSEIALRQRVRFTARAGRESADALPAAEEPRGNEQFRPSGARASPTRLRLDREPSGASPARARPGRKKGRRSQRRLPVGPAFRAYEHPLRPVLPVPLQCAPARPLRCTPGVSAAGRRRTASGRTRTRTRPPRRISACGPKASSAACSSHDRSRHPGRTPSTSAT